MRTTVNIEEHLLRAARQEALSRGEPLGAIIDDALKVFLARAGSPGRMVNLPTDGGSGLRPGVDLEDKDALALLMDGDPLGATT